MLAGYNDLATTDKQLLTEWNYELNKLKPTEVSRNSAKRAWWQCRYGHSWSMKINERMNGDLEVRLSVDSDCTDDNKVNTLIIFLCQYMNSSIL